MRFSPSCHHASSAQPLLHFLDRDCLVSQEEMFGVRKLPIAVPFESCESTFQETVDWRTAIPWEKKVVIRCSGEAVAW